MVTRMDTAIGKLMALLKELKIDDNTLIFFAGDNGNPTGHDKEYPPADKQVPIDDFTPSDVWPSPGESDSDFEARLKKIKAPVRPKNVNDF